MLTGIHSETLLPINVLDENSEKEEEERKKRKNM